MPTKISYFFLSVGAKRLSEVEVTATSNQHEFNGSSKLREIFGSEKINFTGKFLYLADEEDNILEDSGNLTWYDARLNHKTRTEYRLYYATNNVISSANPRDLLIIGRTGTTELLIIVAKAGSTSEQQLIWLFNLKNVNENLLLKNFTEENIELGFARKKIISSLGIEVEEETSVNYLDIILEKFGTTFPPTASFSEFSRNTLTNNISPIHSPDEALLLCLEREELLFKTLERYLVREKLASGFGKDGKDVDDFIKFSLSVQNRRKARAGLSFENHLAFIFKENKLRFSKKVKTERNNEPDFLFPGITEYRNPEFNANFLTMLGLKTTAKDRWRQILPEANRIWPKHLITLEPSISKNQTDEMIAQRVQLILPSSLIQTYTPIQQEHILTLKDFISLVVSRQSEN